MSASPQRFEVDPAGQLLVEDLADEAVPAVGGDCTTFFRFPGPANSLARSIEIEDELAQTHDEGRLVASYASEANQPADAKARQEFTNCQQRLMAARSHSCRSR
jgi:hypothetical protein